MEIRSEEKIKEMIKDIEGECSGGDDCCYLNEGEQAMLSALYWVLGEDTL